MKEEKFPNSRKPSHRRVCREFWNLRGQHNWEEKKKQNSKNMHLTTTASREVAQMLASTTSELSTRGLDRETRAASLVLRIRTRPECPEDNLRELT